MKNNCLVCETGEQFEADEPVKLSAMLICSHDAGVERFVWYGRVPITEGELDKLIRVLKKARTEVRKAAGLEKKRGPKKKPITFDTVMAAIKKHSANATLSEIAGDLKVSEKTLQRAIAPLRHLYESWGTFTGLQAAIKSGEKPLHKKVFFKKIRRR